MLTAPSTRSPGMRLNEFSVSSVLQNVSSLFIVLYEEEPGVTPGNQGKHSQADASPTATLAQALIYTVGLLSF